MGYAATTILVYGVRLSPEQGKRVFDYMNDNFESFRDDRMFDYDCDNLLVEPGRDLGNGRKAGDRERYDPRMFSEGTDSRIHDLGYEPGYNAVVGLYVASKGYAYSDNLEDFFTPDPRYTVNFDRYILPILQELGIEVDPPKILIVNQVW
jgi:hypothetical protein